MLKDTRLGFTEATERLARDPSAVAELRAALPALRAYAAPCGSDAVLSALRPLLAVYGLPDKSEADRDTFWKVYVAVLASLPAHALQKGVRAYVESPDSQFFPKPGPLKALCEPFALSARQAYTRAARAVRLADEGQLAPPPVRPASAAEHRDRAAKVLAPLDHPFFKRIAPQGDLPETKAAYRPPGEASRGGTIRPHDRRRPERKANNPTPPNHAPIATDG